MLNADPWGSKLKYHMLYFQLLPCLEQSLCISHMIRIWIMGKLIVEYVIMPPSPVRTYRARLTFYVYLVVGAPAVFVRMCIYFLFYLYESIFYILVPQYILHLLTITYLVQF